MNGTSDARTITKLKSKEYRDAFVESHARTGIPFQLRAMRAARGWSQEELGQRAGMGQNVIARLENPDYGKFSVSTLLKLASAFDVGLLLRFVSFGELVQRTQDLTQEALNAPSFDGDVSITAGSVMTRRDTAIDTSPMAKLFFPDAVTRERRRFGFRVLLDNRWLGSRYFEQLGNPDAATSARSNRGQL